MGADLRTVAQIFEQDHPVPPEIIGTRWWPIKAGLDPAPALEGEGPVFVLGKT